ncbi:hypothetical protein [Pelagimonas varians]|uniref:Uncharacterized protein n=1 Tax=Pelagimonas varians TaxID=696760 RepID=A0A238L7Q2_9RHOB|nr:hypothetical protein [Pelagimonas varians]PYG25094.1 hypothetical protein C8N36_13516 [Pelagimonas varians]SMX50402.1 hypothetical protein PEV8663_04631 [Pelagimonas varians]
MRYAEITKPNLLQDAFYTYRRNNLANSEGAFSQCVLGQRPNYYSSMMARGRRPSLKVMKALLDTTMLITDRLFANPHYGQPYAMALNQAYEELEQLSQDIAVKLELQVVADQWDCADGKL